MKNGLGGYFNCADWVAVKMTEEDITECLDLDHPVGLTFREGLLHVHTNHRRSNSNSILITPEIETWRLIMGCQLQYLPLSTDFCKKLSQNLEMVFSFGVDIWCAYYGWMCARNGTIIRYHYFSEGEVENFGTELEFEKELVKYSDERKIFRLSQRFGLDMNLITRKDLGRPAKIWKFKNEISW